MQFGFHNVFFVVYRGTEEELFDWFKTQFERSYNNSRAPVSLLFNAGFFQTVANSTIAVSR